MEEITLKETNNLDIIEEIKRVILSKYPILENRIDPLFHSARAIETDLRFFKKEKKMKEYMWYFVMEQKNLK